MNQIDLVLSDINFDYDVIATTDSVLPDDRGERLQMLADLFRLGLLDRQAFLDGVDFPDRNEILKRLASNTTGKTPPEADMNAQQTAQQVVNTQLQQPAQPQQPVAQY
jgi:hypothetical protein